MRKSQMVIEDSPPNTPAHVKLDETPKRRVIRAVFFGGIVTAWYDTPEDAAIATQVSLTNVNWVLNASVKEVRHASGWVFSWEDS